MSPVCCEDWKEVPNIVEGAEGENMKDRRTIDSLPLLLLLLVLFFFSLFILRTYLWRYEMFPDVFECYWYSISSS